MEEVGEQSLSNEGERKAASEVKLYFDKPPTYCIFIKSLALIEMIVVVRQHNRTTYTALLDQWLSSTNWSLPPHLLTTSKRISNEHNWLKSIWETYPMTNVILQS